MPIVAPEPTHENPARLNPWLYVDEITHRTLNDYTAMLSLLRRASTAMPDPAGAAVLEAVATRLRAAASAYSALRPQRGSSIANLDDDLEHVCAALTASILRDRSIRLTLSSDRVQVRARRSWQISLIISELIMNAAKHAFSTYGGAIAVNVGITGTKIQCAVIDNGQADSCFVAGRGSLIIDALAADLGGEIVREFSASGSTVVLQVPARQPGDTFCQ